MGAVAGEPCPEPAAGRVLDLPVEQVRGLVRERYGLRPQRIERVEGELATICRLEDDAGRGFAVKVSRDEGEQRAAVEWRTAVMARLAGQGQPVPGILTDRSGSAVSVTHVGGTPVLVVVEEWLTGLPLHAAEVDRTLLHEIGTTAARLSAALAAAPPPPPGLTHVWEASRGQRTILEALPDVPDPATRDLAVAAAEGFAADVAPQLAELPRTVVHQDLHDANLLVGQVDGRPRVTGVLDFGDMLDGLRVAELAVAAGYAARLTGDPLQGLLDVVAGWGREASLSEAEAQVVLPLARTRLAVNATVWAARSSGTRAAYAAARSARSVPALQALLAADRDAVAAEVHRLTRA
ncbi:phosphotransferase [Geodermatophilus chilensis]|uniref:phosphotransferase n=1 Tax=Geodermatophilus chilensis TaxID=2035835 RepID=UPI0013000A44|nr:phosphotransferase [Geodermatophilus chilensis]